MTERNVCIESGCKAACCRNMIGQTPGRAEIFLKAFPGAITLNSEDELKAKVKNHELGVYYFEERGWTYFSISGPCPNLQEDANCGIHNFRFYPRPCANMLFESQPCEQAKYLNEINSKVSQSLI